MIDNKKFYLPFINNRFINNKDGESVGICNYDEIKWVSYLLNLNQEVLRQKLTHKITEARSEKVLTPFNIDQALDARLV